MDEEFLKKDYGSSKFGFRGQIKVCESSRGSVLESGGVLVFGTRT